MYTNKLGALSLRERRSMQLVLLVLALALTVALAASPALAQLDQESEQEGESGELDQSGEVSQSGDNSNQCVAIQPVGNTGNAQTIITIEQYQSYVEEFEFDDVGSSIEIEPEQIVECDQAVNQAATAAGEDSGYCTWYWDNGWWCYWSTDGSWWYQDYSGSWTAYDTGLWYPDYYYGGWWWLGYDGWWWTDGYYWTYYGWDTYTTVSNVSAEALNGTGRLASLGVLATLGLAGTGLVVRRNQRRNSEG